jgi:uroporphyrin-III C-methyltransferase/precorrin-2 dehydrogenase/sirohydrochlorin ferrochelatase
MRYFPVFVDLEGAKLLLVGGGEQAAQKLRLALKTPAMICVVAPSPCPEIEAAARRGRIRLERRAFRVQDLEGCRLAISAVEDAGEAARVAAAARAAGVLLNAVDRQDLSSFITPAIVDRDPVVVAIGTEGTGPVMARRIKATLEALLPARLGAFARWAGGLRERVAEALPAGPARRRFWEQLFGGEIARAWLAGEQVQAAALAETTLEAIGRAGRTGFVSIVGAGPGDPDLLTFKALRALQSADVIVVDRLVAPQILERARRDAIRVFVGKTPGGPSTTQAEIDALLVREARRGRHVVRLKGGDPLVFGRAVEEMRALSEADIAFEVVPGITAALACAASIGLPLTERDARRSLVLLTGHATDGAAEHDWRALARPGQMLAVYMGVGAAAHVEARLREAGIDPATPVTIVENGTLPAQKVALGSAGTIVETLIDHGIKGPAIIFVGAHPFARGANARHIAPASLGGEAAWLAPAPEAMATVQREA